MVDEAFGHERGFGHLVLGDFASWNDLEGRADRLDGERGLGFLHQRAADFGAVLEDEVVTVVATFHLGVGSEDVVKQGFGRHRSGSRKIGPDNAALLADFVAGQTGRTLFATFCGIALSIGESEEIVAEMEWVGSTFGYLKST